MSLISRQRGKVLQHVQLRPEKILVPFRRFSHIHVDLVGPLPPSQGFRYLLTCVDRSTRCFKENIVPGILKSRTLYSSRRIEYRDWVSVFVTFLDCWITSFFVTTMIKIVNNNTNDKQTSGISGALDEDSPYTNSVCLH